MREFPKSLSFLKIIKYMKKVMPYNTFSSGYKETIKNILLFDKYYLVWHLVCTFCTFLWGLFRSQYSKIVIFIRRLWNWAHIQHFSTLFLFHRPLLINKMLELFLVTFCTWKSLSTSVIVVAWNNEMCLIFAMKAKLNTTIS